MVWKHDLDTLTGEESLFGNPLFYKGNPIFIIYDQWDCQFGSANRVTCLDAETGEKLWGFDVDDVCTTLRNGYVYEDILALIMDHELAGYDLNTRQKKWSIPINYPMQGSFGLHGIRDKVYLSISHADPQSAWVPEAALLEVDMTSGTNREITRFSEEEWGGFPTVHPPSLWIHPSTGDSILMVAVGFYRFSGGPEDARHSIHAYNLHSDSYLWQVDSIGIPANNIKRVEVYEDKVYMVTDYRVHCFDAFTGDNIWSTILPCCTQYVSIFSDSRLLVSKGKVIANPTTDNMYCLDANTGEILWELPNYTATANQDLLEYNGVIYLSSSGNGLLLGVDLETGEILMKEKSPNVDPSFCGENVIVNPEKNLLFVNDFKSAFAYRPVR
ncbi:MAG: PQQ-binding-like beta-propeller repeat protein [Saprospiraceae bacterium]